MEKNLYTNGAIIDYGTEEQELLRAKLSPNIDVASSNKIHIVIDGQRLDQISYKYYGSNRFWWVIADFNDLQDTLINPFFDIEAGTKLIIPDINNLENARVI